MDKRMREVHRYAIAHQFRTGYSTMEQGLVGSDLEYQGVLFPTSHADLTSVKVEDLDGDPQFNNIGDMFRAAHRYASASGYATGFPVFEQGLDVDGDVVYGVALLKATTVTVRSVPAADLGNPNFGNGHDMMIAVHRYARNLPDGFVSGFPLFEQGLQGGVLHYGVALVNANATFRPIWADALGIFSRFQFDPSVTDSQQNKLLECHVFAIGRITACGNLSDGEKDNLKRKYREEVKHGSSTMPGVNAFAYTSGPDGGKRINVNFSNLFPNGDVEIAQTLIHEMMHLAGYDHPDRQPTDTPLDNGPYYGTPPLQAEICIAGGQSLAGGAHPHRDCTKSTDGYTVRN